MDLMSEDMLQDGFTKIVLKNAKKKLEFDKKKMHGTMRLSS